MFSGRHQSGAVHPKTGLFRYRRLQESTLRMELEQQVLQMADELVSLRLTLAQKSSSPMQHQAQRPSFGTAFSADIEPPGTPEQNLEFAGKSHISFYNVPMEHQCTCKQTPHYSILPYVIVPIV